MGGFSVDVMEELFHKKKIGGDQGGGSGGGRGRVGGSG